MIIVSKPSSLELSGNLTRFLISSTQEFTFKLEKGSATLFEQVYNPGSAGQVEIDVREIVESQLSFTLDNTGQNYYQQSTIFGDFVATINAEVVNFRVIRSGVENISDAATNFLTANWLTWQPQIKKVTYYSPEFLTFYAVLASTIKCKAYFSDSTSETITIGSVSAGSAYTILTQYGWINSLLTKKLPSYFDIWVEDANGNRLTYIQRYLADHKKSEEEQWILFENSLGGLDTLRASGNFQFSGEHKHNVVEIDEEKGEYRIDTDRKYTKNTGFLDEYERRWLLDFFPSKGKYIYSDSVIRKIIVTESDVNYSAKALPSSFSFTWQLSSSKPYLNLQRNSNLPAEVTLPVPDVGDFTLPPRLIEFPHITLTGGALIPVQDPYSETLGVMTLATLIAYINTEGTIPQAIVDSLYSLATDSFLSKVNPGTAQKLIKFLEGIQTGNFVSGASGANIDKDGNAELKALKIRDLIESPDSTLGAFGSGFKMWMEQGKSHLEIDNLLVRMGAVFNTLTVAELKSSGGQILVSSADMKCIRVEDLESVYRCFFDNDGGNIINQFVVNDQAKCQRFTGAGIKYYWRRVDAIGADYIDLSKTDADGTGVPERGDSIVQLGHRTLSERQNALLISAYGADAPSLKQYAGIHTYNLEGCETTVISPSGNKIVGNLYIKSGQNTSRVPRDCGAWKENDLYAYYDRVSDGGALWLCVIEEGTTTTQRPGAGGDWEKQVSEGESPVQVTILSSQGNIFKYGIINTVLTAKVHRGGEDITASLSQDAFRWVRTSDNADADAVWNAAYANFGSNVLSISGADVEGKATFNCNVTIPD